MLRNRYTHLTFLLLLSVVMFLHGTSAMKARDAVVASSSILKATADLHLSIGSISIVVDPSESFIVLTLATDGSGIQDTFGNALTADAVESWLNDATSPTAAISPIDSSVRTTPVDSAIIVFNEPVSELALSDFFLTRDGGSDLLPGPAALSSNDNITWTITGLAGITADTGSYELFLSSASGQAIDLAGNETGTHTFSVWVIMTGEDFGDAPAPYPTTVVANGASHTTFGPRLGATRDIEPDGKSSAAATGDGDDEDGVMFGFPVEGFFMILTFH